MQRRNVIIIKKIISEINVSFELMGDVSLEEFLDNEMLKRAMGMTVINIGELVKNITDDVRIQYSAIPWKEIAGFRDITAHRYQILRMEDVYNTVKFDFPEIQKELMKIDLTEDN